MSKSIPSILLFLWFSIVTCKIENEDVNITFRTELPKEYIGKNGTIVISAEPSDKFDRDTSKQICFKSKITNGKDTYPVDCGFWKSSSEGKYFYAFCNIYKTSLTVILLFTIKPSTNSVILIGSKLSNDIPLSSIS